MGYTYVTQYNIELNGELKNSITLECDGSTHVGVEEYSAEQILSSTKSPVKVRLSSYTSKKINGIVKEFHREGNILVINTMDEGE